MLCPFYFKAGFQRYNILEIDEDGKTTEQRFSGVDLQSPPTDYHTWGCPIFVLEAPLQGGPEGPPKWEPRARTGVYIENSPFNTGSVYLVLNIRTGHATPQYHVVFEKNSPL